MLLIAVVPNCPIGTVACQAAERHLSTGSAALLAWGDRHRPQPITSLLQRATPDGGSPSKRAHRGPRFLPRTEGCIVTCAGRALRVRAPPLSDPSIRSSELIGRVTDPNMEARRRMHSRGRRTTPPSRQGVEGEHESPPRDINM